MWGGWIGRQVGFLDRRSLSTATKIPLMYSFFGKRGLSPNFHIHESVSDLYIVPGSVYIFPPAEKADPSWEYINHSQTHECGNWD